MLRFPSVIRVKSKLFDKELSTVIEEHHTEKKPKKSKIHSILTWREFMITGFIMEMSLFQVEQYIDITIRYGTVVVFLAYFLFGATVDLSFNTMILFWGCYTQSGYIRLWEMVPLLKGVAWGVTLFSMYYEVVNISMAGLSLTFIPDLFHRKLAWSDCIFVGATNLCRSIFNPNENANSSTLYHYPAHEYLNNVKIQVPANATAEIFGKLQMPWLTCTMATWVLIFLMLCAGFENYKTILHIIALILHAIFLIATFVLVTSAGINYETPHTIQGTFKSWGQPKFWLLICCHAFKRRIPAHGVMLGAHGPKSVKPHILILCLFVMKILCMVCMMIWLSTCLHLLKINHNIASFSLIPVDGLTVLFAIIPDVLSQLPASRLLLFIYFFELWYFGFLSAIYTCSIIVASIMEVVPNMLRLRRYFCIILCCICAVLNLLFVTNLYPGVLMIWAENVFTILSCALCGLFGIGILTYSISKYGDDYYFMYGKPLTAFWKENIKFFILIAFTCLYIAISTAKTTGNKFKAIEISTFVAIGIDLVPIFFVMIAIYTKYKNASGAVLSITPTINWGPSLKGEKLERMRFKEQQKLRRNQNKTCSHNCLLSSVELEEEIEILRQNCSRLEVGILKP